MRISDFLPVKLVAGVIIIGQAISPLSAVSLQFFGEDLNSNGSIPPAEYPNALNARNQFFSYLSGVGTETFEGVVAGAQAPDVSFSGAGTASLSGGEVIHVPNGTANGRGRWATSGDQLLETRTLEFSISFDNPGGVAAFGFYGTDIGDFGGSLTLEFVSGASKVVTVGHTVGGELITDGSVFFFGYINTDDPFKKVIFGNSTGGSDVFGFDDLTIGSLQQVSESPVPEVSGMNVMVGLGLVGLAIARLRSCAL